MSFDEVAARFAKVQPPKALNDWVSPYRLLFGAGYSIGNADPPSDHIGADIPLDLSSWLTAVVQEVGAIPWFRFWNTSYLLTSAIFRIAAAAEKICYLAAGQATGKRSWLWDSVRNGESDLSKMIPAHSLLGGMPELPERGPYLERQRHLVFPAAGTIEQPLVCAFIQTDDKHLAYPPQKALPFDRALATLAFFEACELWDAAAAAMRPGAA